MKQIKGDYKNINDSHILCLTILYIFLQSGFFFKLILSKDLVDNAVPQFYYHKAAIIRLIRIQNAKKQINF